MGNIVSTTNVVSQIGQEVGSPGSGGAAGKKLRSLDIKPANTFTIRKIEAQGHRFSTGTVKDKQWTDFQTAEAVMTYTEHLYCLENIFGAGTLTSPGTNTKKRVYTPPLTGGITPKTWTHQWGDPADNVNQYGYGFLMDYAEKWDRDTGVSNSGTGRAQLITTGGVFTSSPTSLAEIAVAAGDFNVYLDSVAGNLGSTQITDEINILEWSVKGMKSERWAANRGNTSFAGVLDMKPTWELKITIFEGSVARPIISNMHTGQRYYLRLDAQNGTYIDNYFTVGVGGASAGTFTLTYKGQTTAAIAYNATAAAVQSALVALSTIGAGNVTVTGTAPTWTITMSGTLANDATTMTGSGTGLTGGSFSITPTQLAYMARRDFALDFMSEAALGDTKGAYGRQLTFAIAEDATLAAGVILTSQTAEATL